MFFNKLLIGCFSLLALTACNKEVSELPEATQTGANTFGAKIDGVMWAPRGFGPFPASNLLVARFNTATSILINARNFASSPNETGFELLIADVTGPGTYLLNSNVSFPSTLGYGYFVKKKFTPQDEWVTTTTNTGSVTITKLDPANKIVSGSFEFTAASISNISVPIQVTEGRFDLKLQ